MSDIHHPTNDQQNLGHENPGYEHSDADAGPLSVMAVTIGLLVIVSLTGIAIMWRVMAYETHYVGDLEGSPLAGMRPLPPSPRLQTTPGPDLKQTREDEAARLTTYDWVSKEKGIVRIPVDRAMDLIMERGLPAGKPEAAKAVKK